MVMLEEVQSAKGFEYVFGKVDIYSGTQAQPNSADNNNAPAKKFFNLLDQQMNVGDYICVSTEDGAFGLGTGTIKKLTLDTVVINSGDKISQPLDVKCGRAARKFEENSALYG